jgi:hypothetical protein
MTPSAPATTASEVKTSVRAQPAGDEGGRADSAAHPDAVERHEFLAEKADDTGGDEDAQVLDRLGASRRIDSYSATTADRAIMAPMCLRPQQRSSPACSWNRMVHTTTPVRRRAD